MKRYSDRFLRIAFFISRSSKLTREWFRGTMLYTRHNPKWFIRAFELGNGHDKELLDFGSIRPDGIIACGVPVRFLQKFFRERGMGDVPIMAFPQTPYPGIGCGCVSFDCEQIVTQAIDRFKRYGCRHVAYAGTVFSRRSWERFKSKWEKQAGTRKQNPRGCLPAGVL